MIRSAISLVSAVLLSLMTPGCDTAALAGQAAQPNDQPGSAWVWPLEPEPAVLHGFDPPVMPWLAGHRGVDLAAQEGQEVRAAADGVVTFAGPVAGRYVVTVSHGDLRTTYEPVDPLVKPGAVVDAGAPIGTISASGAHCGVGRPCLHWGLLRGPQYLDPLATVGRGPIRLLPVWDLDRAHASSAGTTVERQPNVVDGIGSKERSHSHSGMLTAVSVLALGGLAAAALVRRL